ncbi:hypothetical protein GQ43DRAFT_467998 [Delitschia confertaspora ATCC 74209]|uniref:Uncharacterized protein n=1 Tax=Delitschia confertaspora ATCC 74209 TaxID=1513339 RepID=A0A9P4MZU3_9PLEO|nr:hypothetical protein GQ43DRAFT_467998 [Delitschia confertaspora ATCC 74209]
MAIIWGLDLKEMQWGKFKNSYMWNTEYHRRRTKFIVYQLAMIFCVVSESLGTAALSDYVDQQKYLEHHHRGATVHNNLFIGAASYNIFVGIYVATIFGSAFFFDLFWPERHESRVVIRAWRICSVLACLFALASALALTVIVARYGAYVTGVDAGTAERLLREYGGSPMRYGDNGRAIASVVFIWPGFLSTVASTFLLWHSLSHIAANGPKSKHAKTRDEVTTAPVASNGTSPVPGTHMHPSENTMDRDLEESKEVSTAVEPAPVLRNEAVAPVTASENDHFGAREATGYEKV